MARTEMAVGEGSRRINGVRRGREQGGKYARYTEEQIEVLEKAYAECSNPNHFQRAQIIEQPVLRGIDNKQLKVWFQNRRCREKQKRESGDLVLENRRLTAANKLLREENDGLQKKLTQLMCENEHLRNQVLSLTSPITTFDLDNHPEAYNSQMPIMVADNEGLLSLAEETRNEFLSKAIGTAINWIPVPGLKLHTPDVVGTVYVSSTCIGLAARACATISFEPSKTIEMLKDRPSWSRCCRYMEVLAEYPANNGGTIELIYTKYYAPTIMALARDFWTLRYSSVLDDGSFVVCEKSISCSDAGPSSPAALEFVRGRMLASGYMICPGEGGSTIHLVEHLDLEASSVPELVRPLYESSEFLAKKTIVSALRYLEHVANETNGKLKHACREDPTFLRLFSQKICRGFNDAVNCFSEDGWTLNANSCNDVIISTKRAKNYGAYANCDSVMCMKASLLLQNVFPANLVKLLKDRRPAWMGFNFADHSVASRPANFAFPGLHTYQLYESPVLLGHTNHEDEALEIIQLECRADRRIHHSSRDLYHLQVINGMEDNGFGACSELIFVTVDRSIPNGAASLSCGFRIFLLGSNTDTRSSTNLTSMLILAFQFPFESPHQDEVIAVARQYVQHVLSSVKNISLEIMPSGSNPDINATEANPAIGFNITPNTTISADLASLICQSYRSSLGVDMLGFNCQTPEAMLKQIQHHQYAILCFSFSSIPVCLYANQAALNMVEITPDNLQMLTVDSILGGSNNFSLASVLPTLMQQGYAILPSGRFISVMNRSVSYDQAVVWQVQAPDGSFNCLALAFVNWSFTPICLLNRYKINLLLIQLLMSLRRRHLKLLHQKSVKRREPDMEKSSGISFKLTES